MATSRAQLIEQLRLKEELEQREIIRKCSEDAWYWLQNYTKTFDEHAAKKGVDVYKPFPDKDYLRVTLELFRNPENERIFAAKSREMMLSWLAAGYITWDCQFHERTRWIIQSKSEDTAAELLAYCKCLYSQQPEWLKKRFPLKGNKLETEGGVQSKLLQLWQNESRVKGVPQGPDQIRSGHPTGVFFDEACFIEGFEAAYASAAQVTPKIIAISSAVPGGFFAQVCSGS
jgi:hypothetical protein